MGQVFTSYSYKEVQAIISFFFFGGGGVSI